MIEQKVAISLFPGKLMTLNRMGDGPYENCFMPGGGQRDGVYDRCRF